VILFILRVALFGQALFALTFLALPLMPESSWSNLLEYSLLFSPRWAWLILVVMSGLGIRQFGKRLRILWFTTMLVTVVFQDISVPQRKTVKEQSENTLALLSLNIGGGTSPKMLATEVRKHQPTLVFLQESSNAFVKQAFDKTWNTHCQKGLCIASRKPITLIRDFSRDIIQGWGSFLAAYSVELSKDVKITVFNIHFETPRPVLTSLMNRSINLNQLDRIHISRNLQASVLEALTAKENQFIIAGDFNMTVNERIYKKHFSHFSNALSEKARGIRYTKYTSFHGVRIDHILTSNNVFVNSAEVLQSLGGDHRAILVKL
jgi:endonuclease/exonuclease/phosphatase (EEP) superfamily protein YafD